MLCGYIASTLLELESGITGDFHLIKYIYCLLLPDKQSQAIKYRDAVSPENFFGSNYCALWCFPSPKWLFQFFSLIMYYMTRCITLFMIPMIPNILKLHLSVKVRYQIGVSSLLSGFLPTTLTICIASDQFCLCRGQSRKQLIIPLHLWLFGLICVTSYEYGLTRYHITFAWQYLLLAFPRMNSLSSRFTGERSIVNQIPAMIRHKSPENSQQERLRYGNELGYRFIGIKLTSLRPNILAGAAFRSSLTYPIWSKII